MTPKERRRAREKVDRVVGFSGPYLKENKMESYSNFQTRY